MLKIDTRNISILQPLAYTLHLKGEYLRALDLYHKINFIKSDDPMIGELINRCLQDMNETGLSDI
jgi:hypothetical protein